MSTVSSEEELEEYKREFQRKRWEREQEKKAAHERQQHQLHRVAWYLAFPIFIFSLILVIDDLIPAKQLMEQVLRGWQERGVASRRHRGELKSFMQTTHYKIRVSHDVHLSYPYYQTNKPAIHLSITPIFNIPRFFSIGAETKTCEVLATVHSIPIPFPWLLLVSCAITLLLKDFSKLAYAICFMPELLLGIIIVIMI